VQDSYREFKELGAGWVAITSDTLDNLRALASRRSFSFPLLSDPGGKVARSYGVLWAEDGGYNEPGVFVVGTDGTLTFLGVISGAWGRPPVPDVLTVVRGAWNKAREDRSPR